jgi:hypothetical protein
MTPTHLLPCDGLFLAKRHQGLATMLLEEKEYLGCSDYRRHQNFSNCFYNAKLNNKYNALRRIFAREMLL